mmetsp:Transcript_98746/g.175788  ORF Transcript_98746/g.175788 Transcript_98746/m.175788 type:complete len:101 (+) Transcript_98746:645-947(+)
MDVLDGASALARPNERVIFGRSLEETNAASRVAKVLLVVLRYFTGRSRLIEEERWLLGSTFPGYQLPNSKLETPKLDDVTLREFVAAVGKVLHDDPYLLV